MSGSSIVRHSPHERNSRRQAAPQILEFDQQGNLMTSFGGPAGLRVAQSEHGIYVDYKGNV
jgi:hypothetical protein